MIKPITRKEYNKVLRLAKDALELACHHDPEHAKELKKLRKDVTHLDILLGVVERQLQRLGAPQYRRVR